MRLLTFDVRKQYDALFLAYSLNPVASLSGQELEPRKERLGVQDQGLDPGSKIQDQDAEAEERRGSCYIFPALICFEQRWF